MKNNPWTWIPSLYYAEGLPYIIVNALSVIMFGRMDISNAEIALYTSWLYLPWVIKPLWSPIVDIFKTKRQWIIAMQFVMAVALAGVAFTIPTSNFFQYTLAFFWLMSFSSATHDIAADGFYMIGLAKHQQAFFVGIRSTFYRLAMISGEGLIVILAGQLELQYAIPTAWAITFGILALIMGIAAFYHIFSIQKLAEDQASSSEGNPLSDFVKTFLLFFKKDRIIIVILFLMTYRLGEAQLVKIAPLFLLDSSATGLGLSTSEVGIINGTIGTLALTLGGILGGIVVTKQGLKFWLWWMLLAINLPNAAYLFLSIAQPESFWIIGAAVTVEKFGYGFGFTAYMLYMIYIADGEHKTAHFALATGFMALGMMLPGMASGWLQEIVGYQTFFLWVLICALPGFLVAGFTRIEPSFGKKEKTLE